MMHAAYGGRYTPPRPTRLLTDVTVKAPMWNTAHAHSVSSVTSIVYLWDRYAAKYAATMGAEHPCQENIENLKIYLIKWAITNVGRENGVFSFSVTATRRLSCLFRVFFGNLVSLDLSRFCSSTDPC